VIYDILRQRREIILKDWRKSALDFYRAGVFNPAEKEADRFSNPLVYTISTALETILDELIDGIHTTRSDEALEDVVKIRSLQSEKPSTALNFLFSLKKIFKDELNGAGGERDDFAEVEKLNSALDNLVLTGFDIFMKCRERIYEIRSNEIKRRSYKLWERAGISDPSLMRKGDSDDDDS
jgi:hypothetical protein